MHASISNAPTLQPVLCTLAEQNGRIIALGELSELQRQFRHAELIDLEQRLVTPGLIDCHTHVVYGGNRALEMERRLAGESYQRIAHSGGGILATVNATRNMSEPALLDAALKRVDIMLANGVTTLEVKSGYGLDLDTEMRMLRVARRIGEARKLSIASTYLGAHAIPPEYRHDSNLYVERLCNEYLPAMAASGLADAFDAYCEDIAFSAVQVERLFKAAAALSLPVKLHADQLSNLHAAALAARFGALSADHLEFTDEAGIAALKRAGTVAVILPGAFYFLREQQRPPIDALRAAGVPLAVATDCNPGTSPLVSLLTAMNMAAVQFGLNWQECLAGVTRNAAQALGLLHDRGTIEIGKWCDLAVWNVDHPLELIHGLGLQPLQLRVWRGDSTR